MPTLPELQQGFLSALLDGSHEPVRGEIVAAGLSPAQRLAIYANNAEANFIESLRLSYPAIRRLVGDAYFSQCARAYRERHPSRSGDLQHVGAAFPEFWAERHGSDEFRYLADIARLEWLYQESLTAADHAPLDLERLVGVAPADYAGLRFRLHPSARLFASDYPVLAIWEANVGSDAEPEIIDLAQGADRLLLARAARGAEMRRTGDGEFEFLQQLDAGAAFAQAIEAAAARELGFDATACLRRLVVDRVIVDFSPPDSPTSARKVP
jgi:hypothetical protein